MLDDEHNGTSFCCQHHSVHVLNYYKSRPQNTCVSYKSSLFNMGLQSKHTESSKKETKKKKSVSAWSLWFILIIRSTSAQFHSIWFTHHNNKSHSSSLLVIWVSVRRTYYRIMMHMLQAQWLLLSNHCRSWARDTNRPHLIIVSTLDWK